MGSWQDTAMTPLEGSGRMRAGPRRNRIRNGSALALLGALALAMISGALLDAQPASASPAGFTGVSLRSLAVTNTPSVTDTPIATATDTPLPAPTATDTPVATNTPTPAPTATATPRPTPTTTTTRKTVLDINAAATYVGVQQNGNWCGIATIALIANYLYPNSTSQGYIANLISDPNSTSEWGAPTYDAALGYGPGVTADISRDFGTDPRSIAYGLTAATGWQYHAKVDTASAWDATIHIVDDMINTQQPISVFVDHGQHSVIVYGVSTASSTDNPVTNPSSITKIWVWDPGGGVVGTGIQPSQKLAIPISEWLSGLTSWANFYGSDYFKYSYASNIYGGRPLDPDPGVGPYTYVASKYNHLWIGHWVWVSASGGAGLNADWELNQYGALIRGMDGSGFPATPAGYTGSSVPMPNNQPPPPP
ncbi:MAG: hypothetical protein KGO05_00195, partial [Chloroflexota bacterium]|nr:hypothetical protein [Chloroflexota bacterium]